MALEIQLREQDAVIGAHLGVEPRSAGCFKGDVSLGKRKRPFQRPVTHGGPYIKRLRAGAAQSNAVCFV